MRKLGRFAAIGIVALVLLGLGASGSTQPAAASETTVTLTWGTFTVAGFDETPQFVTEPTKMSKPCHDCYITSVTPELEGFDTNLGTWGVANYLSTPPARLHHMVLFNHSYVDPTCAGNPLFASLGDRWFASGDERGTLSFPSNYGYYIPPMDPAPPAPPNNYWNMQVMVHNLSSNPQDYRLKMTFKYHPASDNLKAVRHLWLDQNNCASSQYQVTAGYADDHWAWTDGSAAGTADDIEGRIFEMGGHVHDWGTSVAGTLMKMGTSTETLICASQGGYASGSTFAPDHIASPNSPAAAHPADAIVVPGDPGYQGHIEAMSGCLTNTIIAPGDMIHLHTQYVADSTIPDVMGIMGAWVYDNCPGITNVTQEDLLDDGYPGDGVGDDYGDACDKDADGDGFCNTSGVQGPGGYSCTGADLEDDGDGYTDEAESGTPVCVGATNDDDKSYPVYPGPVVADDAIVNDGCPAIGAAEGTCSEVPAVDDDGDGRVNDGCTQVGMFSEGAYKIGTNPMARCGAGGVVSPSPSWPSDFISGMVSTDKVTLQDITSFVAPIRRYETNPGHANFLARYDLTPGRVAGQTTWINLNDITAMVGGPTGSPSMFGGATKAFNGPTCTGA